MNVEYPTCVELLDDELFSMSGHTGGDGAGRVGGMDTYVWLAELFGVTSTSPLSMVSKKLSDCARRLVCGEALL